MIKQILIAFLFGSFSILSCSPDVTTIQVVRNPAIKFDYNGTSTWQNSTYSFGAVSRTIVYPKDTTKPGQIYNRLTMQAEGKDNAGNDLQLIITFDVADANQLVGIYSPDYTTERGLAQVQIFNLTNSSDLAAYELCSVAAMPAYLNIQKQKADEQLITGTFQATLCNLRDTTNRITITNGIITDITY